MTVLVHVFLNQQPRGGRLGGRIRAFVAAFTLPILFYVVRKQTDLATGRAAVRACLVTFKVAPVDRSTLELADSLNGRDFEDDLQLASAVPIAAGALNTRDVNGFPNAPIPIWSPADLIARLPPAAKP